MKSKKLVYIILAIVLVSLVTIITYKNILLKNNVLEQNPESEKPVHINIEDDERFFNIKDSGIIEDKNTGETIYNPKENYSVQPEEPLLAPKEMDLSYVAEHVKYFLIVYPGQSFDKFDDETISTIVSLSSDLSVPKTEKEVQRVAEKYFGIKNYQLPVGTYEIKGYGDFTVMKTNGYYIRSSINNKKESLYDTFPTDMKIEDNKIKLYLDFVPDSFVGTQKGCYVPFDRKEECIKGYYVIDLTYSEDNNLIVNKIDFQLNDKFDPNATN